MSEMNGMEFARLAKSGGIRLAIGGKLLLEGLAGSLHFADGSVTDSSRWEVVDSQTDAGEDKGGGFHRLEVVYQTSDELRVRATYMLYHKLPARQYLDILAIGLMLALVFGRIGCFLNGCCFGKPTDLPWAVRFPYNSFAYNSQINADPARNRDEPYLDLPREEYFGLVAEDGKWYPKEKDRLTDLQKYRVTKGEYRCLAVHPTQLYSSAAAAVSCLMLYGFWRRAKKARLWNRPEKFLARPGQIFALMFILYAASRFAIEFFRDDNPFEYGPWTMHVIYVLYRGGTVSQNLSIYLAVAGVVLLVVLQKAKPDKSSGS